MLNGARKKPTAEDITRFADMLAAIGTESRLRITQLLFFDGSSGRHGGWRDSGRTWR
jgi:hypothetical protein